MVSYFQEPNVCVSEDPKHGTADIMERSKSFIEHRHNSSLCVSKGILYLLFVIGFLDNKEYRYTYLYDEQVLMITGLPETANQYGQFSVSQ